MKTRINPLFRYPANVVLVAFIAISPVACAAIQTWDVGSGDWDTTSSNWTGTTWTDGNDATFSGAGGTITLASGFTPTVGTSSLALMTFSESYTIKTGSIYLASTVGAGSASTGDKIAVASGKTATLDGIDLTWGTPGADTHRLAVSGSGTLSLLNTNLTGGQFYVGNAGGDTGNVNGHVIQSGGAITLNSALYMGDADAEIDTYQLDSGTISITGTYSQAGVMIIGRRGAATFTQNGGSVTVQRFNNNNAGEIPATQIGYLGTSAYNMTGGTLNVLAGTDGSPNAIWLGGGGGSGNGTLSINGATAQTNVTHILLGGNAASGTGTVSLQTGALRLTQIDKTTGSTGSFNFSGGLLAPYNANTTIGSATAANNFDITLTGTTAKISSSDKDGTGRTVNVYSKITSNGALTFEGIGTTVLSAANDYTGNTKVSGGTLSLANPTLADASTVSIATGATLDLPHGATDIVSSLVLGSTIYTSGTFTASTPGSFISGTGTIQVGAGGSYGSGFTGWINTYYPSLPDKTSSGDSDNDGISNLMEYALNGNPGASSTSILPAADNSNPTDLIFTFTRREESSFDTTQVFQYSSNLTGWSNIAITGIPGAEVTLGTPVLGLQLVTVKVPKSAAVSGKLFGRLQVTQP